MDRNTQNSESPLLLKLPKSMMSFSDMSGNTPFLLPVAVDNVAAPEKPNLSESTSESQDNTKVLEPTSVCQLQQPLLMRRGSSPSLKTAVPYTESNASVANINVGHTEILSSRQPSVVSNTLTSNQNNESMNWPNSSINSSIGQSFQTTSIFTGYQNQPALQPDSVNQSNYPQSVPISQESSNLRYQNIFPPPPNTFSSSSNFPPNNTPALNTTFSSFPEKSDYCTASASDEYYSQPPVITPSAAPAYYNNSGRNTPPATYSSIPSSQSYNMHHSSSLPSEMYSRVYEPVRPYWLFRDIVESKEIWCGFSEVDSDRLEMAFQQDPQGVVPVDGGRYDAVLTERIKKPVYFEAKSLQIRRCTWFFRSESSQRFTPFTEEASSILEQHYSTCVTSGQWQKRVNLPGVGSIVLENPQLLLYYKNEVELWPTLPNSKASPKAVKRGLPENFEILGSENNHIDHLVFIVQGIGSFCDLRFRTVTECVDGFRDIANKLLSSHFRNEIGTGRVGRVEFLPLAWHAKLHTSDQGFDRCMQNITLPSIPKLRHFTNDTLLDILLYSSPFYCQSIIDTVASELNKLYEIFLKRNPDFSGKVFVAGHSLGSLILFDILSNQKMKDINATLNNELNSDKIPTFTAESNKVGHEENIKDGFDSITSLLQACQLEEYTELFEKEKIDLSTLTLLSNDDLKDLGLPTGPCKKILNAVHSNYQVKNLSDDAENLELLSGGTSQVYNDLEKENQENFHDSKSLIFPFKTSPCMQTIIYPRLQFEPACFFALGSPISMFLTVRGYERISEDFRLPTCPSFFHIFHPYDPVAFRIERLIDPHFSAKPVLIPHHKGRKRMHLEIRENLTKVGFEIKQKVLDTLRYTWNSLSGFAKAHTFPSAAVEAEVDKLVSQQMSESEYEPQAPSETSGEEIQIGSLNGGRRIDYVLQEKPIEALNDYIFALTSHATYWDSEDTVLMILREIYATEGIVVSSQSNIETRPLFHQEHSSYEAHSSHFNPCAFESARAEQVPSISPFYNQSMPPTMPSSQFVQMFSNYSNSRVTDSMPPPQVTGNMPLSQVTGNMPPPTQVAGNMPPPTQVAGNMPPPTQVAGNMPPPPQVTGNMLPPPQVTGNMPPPPQVTGNMPPSPQVTGNMPPPPQVTGNMPPPPQVTGNIPPPPPQVTGNMPPPPPQVTGNMPPPPQVTGNMPPPPQVTGNVPPPQVTGNMPPSSVATTQQPVGPPPLTGFIKKSPFTR